MKITNHEAIELLASKYIEEEHGVKSKEFLENAASSFHLALDNGINFNTLKFFPKFLMNTVGYAISKSTEKKRRTTIISKTLGCPKKDIAGELDEYLDNKCIHPIYADDLVYKAYINDDGIENLAVVWGNADLRSVSDLKRLKSLVMVLGDLSLSYHDSLIGLEELSYVGGNINLYNVESLEGLSNDIYVGGEIINHSKTK